MIIYRSSTAHFDLDVRFNKIVDKLENEFIRTLGRKVSDPERRSFWSGIILVK
ncbi:hypothetical protein [Candidatus Contubernalis alkaliaceticus]|uniref:hypothetical protein n=1 Tax=Candidatus Contubernalis alkaliaceticus TaxID=338645 RepID=UPI001F4C153C|nr:hypothetical protein [Candidatus Contubernalis alkalaceticus]UNC92128.1 hypothetical protein HUE98_08470 [Candidatus Contubernalis alkalaceticus]